MSLLFYMGPVNSTSCSLRVWIPFLAAPLTFGCSIIKNARVYTIFYMSRYGKMKKSFARYMKDDILLMALAAIFSITMTSFEHEGYRVSSDRSQSFHVCLPTPLYNNEPSVNPIVAVMIAWIALLIATTSLLSFLTQSIFDTISEASFLSISGMLGAIGFAVSLAMVFGIDSSATNVFIRNIVIWFVANMSLMTLYTPKLVEAFAELHEQHDSLANMGALPNASLLSGVKSVIQAEAVMVRSAPGLTNPESEVDTLVTHVNLDTNRGRAGNNAV
ncbi:hypothetical protein HDU76_013974 [Blyttiomyces sp. JEL0837]|nr:hypothetical protein HDU76_013974 [Blyttiomyces sp. JEL0837]